MDALEIVLKAFDLELLTAVVGLSFLRAGENRELDIFVSDTNTYTIF